jgi:hypothetical protein
MDWKNLFMIYRCISEVPEVLKVRPLQNGTFCPISASGSNFNPRNILYIPVVEIFAFLELEQKLPFFKGLKVK